ncbi:MAG: zinc ribbon domain-containing protein [Gammaproteobacteria bacterium]|nr:zinc ribbon domain-containing protein [Gammaproteobacteria bacterium]MBP9728580.1 zinc ribbon domain-containing protein [Gammaproteobacteria bacterium]
MPIYEYCCEHCHHQKEALQGINDPPLLHCEQCQHDSLKRLLSASGFRLKGGGWYETDFKTAADKQKNLVGTPAVASNTSNTATPPVAAEGASQDAKPTVKTESKTTESKTVVDKSSTTE